jgi:hypothetical protein
MKILGTKEYIKVTYLYGLTYEFCGRFSMIYYRSYNYTTKNGLWFRILEFDICDIYI